MANTDLQIAGLPAGWSSRVPTVDDASALTELETAYQRAARGSTGGANEQMVRLQTSGIGSWTRRQLLVEDGAGRLVARLSVHDRAAGRTVVEAVLHPDLPGAVADPLAASLFAAAERFAQEIAVLRGLRSGMLDSSSYDGDARQRGWLERAGYRCVRTWWHMSRPVERGSAVPAPRPGVTVRRVEQHADGLPVAGDLQIVHRLLEESFQDHFSSYRESFPEFVMRLREDPGHRWDHWWIATIARDGAEAPAGAVVSSVTPADASGCEGTYIDYIGVHRDARGHGVAKALLHAVIGDAAARGRNRVGLEVDAESPTGADGLYTSMGWRTTYTTYTWHRHVDVHPGG
ncbi:GNAT family N-acetyltransferase [Cumulibacter manganitolerans]|uniref:GNAT family N-acetyltransferase n=1 Tax=Cumulibacter manganitolerans TaxID=1884992 RepID=UPI0012957013|nr:GNAT family N-acetyltransferase [Cumulibacter manganitolerans]